MKMNIRVIFCLFVALFWGAGMGYWSGYKGTQTEIQKANEMQDAKRGYWATRRSAENRALHQLLIRYNVPADTIRETIGDFEWKADSVLYEYSKKTDWRYSLIDSK
jgi:hypothetical protein